MPDKNDFCIKLNLEDITDKDYEHVQKVWEIFEIKNRGGYYDLYVQIDTLLLADVFENFRDTCIKMYELDPAQLLSAPGLAWQACLKKTKVNIDLSTDTDMLLTVENEIRVGICQATHRYAKANNKYMKNYNKDIISSYLMYLDANNLYGWAMSQKLPVNGFKWVEKSRLSRFNERFIKNYNENSDIGYFLEVDIDYPKELFNFHKDLPFLPERKKVKKCEKLICSIEDKEKCVVHIRALKQALNHGLILKKVHRVIKFNQRAWLKLMNTKKRKEAKNEFEKDFFKIMINSVFGKTIENLRKHRDIKIVTTDGRRSELISEPDYHTIKPFSEYLLEIEMKKTKVEICKPVYLGISIFDISKTLTYEFWHDYIKPKYGDRAKLCYTVTDSFIIHIFTENFYRDIADDVRIWFDTSNYDENKTGERLLPIGMNNKVYGLFKDELGGKIMKEFCALRPRTYAYLIDYYDDDDYDKNKIINKKSKGTKTCVIKRELMFENYKDCLLKSQQRLKSDHHKVNTEEVNMIALSSNDEKRLQIFDRIETYPYGTTNEMLRVFESKETLKM